jgi:hypothetical protein
MRLARLRSYNRLDTTIRTHDSTDHWFRKYAGSGADSILSFCKAHNIVNEVKNAVNLAEKCFRTQSTNVHLEEDVDPETSDRKIVIRLSVYNKPREEVLASYRAYVKKFVTILPWPQRSHIRLSYNIL